MPPGPWHAEPVAEQVLVAWVQVPVANATLTDPLTCRSRLTNAPVIDTTAPWHSLQSMGNDRWAACEVLRPTGNPWHEPSA